MQEITTLQMNAQIFWNFCSGFMLSYPVQDWENELYSKNSPTANERQYFLQLFVGVLYVGI